ncbi:MAG: hypothetical protein AAFU65_02440 [Pseudomonadota bacterium]
MRPLLFLTANAVVAAAVSVVTLSVFSPSADPAATVPASSPAPELGATIDAVPTDRHLSPIGNDSEAWEQRVAALEARLATLADAGLAEPAPVPDAELMAAREATIATMEQSILAEPPDTRDGGHGEVDLWDSAAKAEAAGAALRVDSVTCRQRRCLLQVANADQDSLRQFSHQVPWDSTVEFVPTVPNGLDGRIVVERLDPIL